MRFILIANNNEINEEMIDKINLQYNDIIILFNHHYPIKFEKIKIHQNKILFMRYLVNQKKILGLDEYLNNNNKFKLILSYYKGNETINYIRDEFYTHYEKIKCRKLLINDFIKNISLTHKYNLKKNYVFSTGFLGYLFAKYFSRCHLKEIFNYDIQLNKILLVGFTGSYPKIQFNQYHDFNKEQQYYEIEKKNNLIDFINPIITAKNINKNIINPIITAKNINKNIINIINAFLIDPSLQKFIFPISNEIKPIINFKKNNIITN